MPNPVPVQRLIDHMTADVWQNLQASLHATELQILNVTYDDLHTALQDTLSKVFISPPVTGAGTGEGATDGDA